MGVVYSLGAGLFSPLLIDFLFTYQKKKKKKDLFLFWELHGLKFLSSLPYYIFKNKTKFCPFRLEALMFCIATMPMEKIMKTFKDVAIGCLKSELIKLIHCTHALYESPYLHFCFLNSCAFQSIPLNAHPSTP